MNGAYVQDVEKAVELIYVFVQQFEYTKEDLEKLCDLICIGVWMPVEIVIARPFIEHLMYSAIMLVSGSQTGQTLYGPGDMQISSNTTSKVIEGHFTKHMNVVITKPENVMVLRDAMSAGYVAGCNTRFFGDGEGLVIGGDGIKTRVVHDLRERLDMDDAYTNNYKSMFAFLSNWFKSNSGLTNDSAFSIGSTPLPWEIGTTTPTPSDTRNFPGGTPHYDKYAQEFGLRYIQAGVNVGSSQRNEYIRNGTYNNIVCIKGPYRCFGMDHNLISVPGKGHLGSDAQPGDAAWRRGECITAFDARRQLQNPAIAHVDSRSTALLR